MTVYKTGEENKMKKVKMMDVYAVGIDNEEYDDNLHTGKEAAIKDYIELVTDDMLYVTAEEVEHALDTDGYHAVERYHITKRKVFLD